MPPKIARVAGLGVVTIAKHSGRPIYPVAIATSNRILAKKALTARPSICPPKAARGAVAGDGLRVPADAGPESSTPRATSCAPARRDHRPRRVLWSAASAKAAAAEPAGPGHKVSHEGAPGSRLR